MSQPFLHTYLRRLFYPVWTGYNSPMIELNIPGRGLVSLEHLVCDVNGSLAVDGQLLEGIPRLLSACVTGWKSTCSLQSTRSPGFDRSPAQSPGCAHSTWE